MQAALVGVWLVVDNLLLVVIGLSCTALVGVKAQRWPALVGDPAVVGPVDCVSFGVLAIDRSRGGASWVFVLWTVSPLEFLAIDHSCGGASCDCKQMSEQVTKPAGTSANRYA